jgi:signal transduction histidine kinase
VSSRILSVSTLGFAMKNSILATTLTESYPDKTFLDLLAFNEKMAELGRVSAGIIHEVNTPLSVIISAAQLVMQEEGVPEAALEMVERIHAEALRLSQMTRGILSFARRDDDSSGEVDVCHTSHEVVRFLRYEIGKRSILVEESYDDHLPLLPGGGNRLKQVLLNLVMNGVQAMGQGGRLSLACTLNEQGDTEIRVSDTGPGIPPETLSRIFDPFYTTKKDGEGTGLGLFVSRNLVSELHGCLSVLSLPGVGTTFTISFPSPVT